MLRLGLNRQEVEGWIQSNVDAFSPSRLAVLHHTRTTGGSSSSSSLTPNSSRKSKSSKQRSSTPKRARKHTSSSAASSPLATITSMNQRRTYHASQDPVSWCNTRKTDQEDTTFFERLEAVILQLMKHPLAEPFLDPVDSTLVPTYHLIISSPMDFHTIVEHLKQQRQSTTNTSQVVLMRGVLGQLAQIWSNCILFNGSDSPLGLQAGRMQSIAARLVDQWMVQTPGCTPVTELENEDHCQVCHGGHALDSLLLCDSCDAAFHVFCLTPPLRKIPRGKWYCTRCFV